MNKRFPLRAASFLLAALLLLSALGCRKDPAALLESSKEEKTVVMTIGGMDVPMELYRYAVLNHKADYERGASVDIWLGDDGQALIDKLNADVTDTLTALYATPTLCQAYGIDPEDSYITDAVDARMSEIYEPYGGDYAAYLADLADYNMNDGVYRFIVRNDVLAEELLYAMITRGEITNDSAELRSIIESDDFIRVKQILLPAENGKTIDENRAQAEELLGMLRDGADFDELVGLYGGDVNLFDNPDGYYITKGSYLHAFEDAAFSLAVGEVSGIVETSVGISIIKRYEKEHAYLTAHADELANDYISSQYNLAVEAHQATLTVTPTDALSDYGIFNLDIIK